jgi:cytochrome c peroxidase
MRRSSGDGLCSRAKPAAQPAIRTIRRCRCLAITASTTPDSPARKRDFNQLAARALKSAAAGNKAEVDKLALETDYSDLGRFLVTQKREDIGTFKTPFLRDVILTGPYMHDGSLETLWDVVEFFNKGGERNPFLDVEMKPLGLTESEVDDLVRFMSALTSDRFAELRATEQDRQQSTYLYRLAVQREMHKGSR